MMFHCFLLLQAFHICAGDGTGGLTKYSFLCPNGTLFHQQYFVCDWWFNVDCSTAEQFYYLNEAIAEEAAQYSADQAGYDSSPARESREVEGQADSASRDAAGPGKREISGQLVTLPSILSSSLAGDVASRRN